MEQFIFNQPVTEISTTRKDKLGSLRCEGGKIYKYVQIQNTTATVAGAAGDVAAYEAEDGVANNVVCLDLSDADSVAVPAGVLQGTVTGSHNGGTGGIPIPEYGWIQVTGAATLNQALGGSAGDGHPLYLASTDKTLTKAVEADSAGVYKTVCAVANDASAKTVVCCFPY